ncbi:hypothetical protein [Micromonospora cathayae]|uniref:hypothetical protein n=1 Tax=Micromonospora cathayae TaxID=3028804 RepID=UPI003C6D1829
MRRSTKRLLGELDVLAYRDRMARLARRSRELAAKGELTGVLADLRAGVTYHRLLALTAAQVVGDRDAVRAALADPYRPIRATALAASVRAGWLTATELADLLDDAPADLRRTLYRRLRRARRPGLADELVDRVHRGFGDAEAAVLLPACGPATVRRLLPVLAHAVPNWLPLARRHGEVLLDHAAATLPGLGPTERSRWWATYGGAVLAVGERHPDRVLALLEGYAPADRLPGAPTGYGPLATAAPRRVLALLTAPGRADWLGGVRLPAAVLRRVGRAAPRDEALVTLGRRLRGRPDTFRQLLVAQPPAVRGELYDAVLADVATDRRIPSEIVVEVLPRAWREREGRRLLTLEVVRQDESAVRRWSALLPWPEASAALTPALRAADPQDRATGWALLLTAARRSGDPAAVADAVARLTRLRNEQDPVRVQALSTLAGLSRLLRADSVEVLAQVTVDATTTRDASTGTLSALGTLAARVLGHHVTDPALSGWALDTLDRLFGGHHLPPLERFDLLLRRGQERLVVDRLRGWLAAGMARGRFVPLFAVTRALGRRAWRLPELQELLYRASVEGTVGTVVQQAVELWLADPRSRADRVARVLADDPSTVTFPTVWRTVSARRTDLLDAVLLGPPPAGAFLTAGVRWVPPRPVCPHRWLPRQQQAFVALQARLAADAGTPLHQRAAAIRAAAPVPDAGRELVLRYVDAADVTLAEAALGALPWTDRPAEALPLLLSYADDDRARVALYAAGRTARFLRPSELVGPLSRIALGRGKVTSRKEALRLLGRFGPATALPVLVAAWQQPDQHRDVRAAVVATARQRLRAPESWTVLEQAVDGGREDARSVLATWPADVAVADRPRYAALVVRACAHPDPVVVRAAWSALGPWLPWAPDVTDLATAAFTDLRDRHTWSALRPVVGALLDHPDRPERAVLGRTVRALVRADEADPDPGGPADDRPARRRLAGVLTAAGGWAGSADPRLDRSPVRAVARELAGHPAYLAPAAGLLTDLLRLDGVPADQLTAELVEIAGLVDGRPALAGRLADRLAGRHRRRAATVDPDLVLDAARALAARGGAASGLFAVALARRGAEFTWSAPWRELLHALRAHPVADVRDVAFDLSMATT